MRKLLLFVQSILFVGQDLECSCHDGYESNFYKNITNNHKLGVFVFHSHGVYVYPGGFQSVWGNIILPDNFSLGLANTLSLNLDDGVNCAQLRAFAISDMKSLTIQDRKSILFQ